MTDHLLIEREGAIAKLIMNRPQARNAMTGEMLGALHSAAVELAADPEVRCVVLTGAGSAFCAGGDVKGQAANAEKRGERGRPSLEQSVHGLRQGMELSKVLHEMPKPTLAGISGVILTGIFFICGWTGYVMVWDVHGQLLAVEGARIFDALPLFGEPIARTFSGENEIPNAFFFLNLFAHILFPCGVGLMLWIHVSRLARTYLMPPRPLFWGTTALLTVVAVAWPAPMAPEADMLRVPGSVPFDVPYGFWLPVTRMLEPGWVWLAMIAALALLVAVPWMTRPPREKAPPPSYVHPRYCTGCEQCYHDCPYEAIAMVKRDDGRAGFVGLVDPAKCVSCGICSGSCAPMGVGPQGRTGRDQLTDVKAFIDRVRPGPEDVVVIGCWNAVAGRGADRVAGAPVFPVSCAGSLHTSVIEYLVRAGAGGVMVASYPPRDCWNREGVTWMEERIYNEREAELKDRVDRRRVRVVYAAEAEASVLESELAIFRSQMQALERALGESAIEVDTECVVPEVSVGEEATP